uniref:Uncharacterized protein n=1 Tax=Arundo donax TaxID=35708 RepID=A0A0A9GH51_ARUDO
MGKVLIFRMWSIRHTHDELVHTHAHARETRLSKIKLTRCGKTVFMERQRGTRRECRRDGGQEGGRALLLLLPHKEDPPLVKRHVGPTLVRHPLSWAWTLGMMKQPRSCVLKIFC